MSTAQAVYALDLDLSAAFEELAVVRAMAKPKGYSGMSFALEEASGDAEEAAKKTVWQRFKAWLKPFLDWCVKMWNTHIRRKKDLKEKAEEVKEKMEKKQEKAEQAAKDTPKDLTAEISKVVKENMGEIDKTIITAINEKCNKSAAARYHFGKEQYNEKDIEKLSDFIKDIIKTEAQCLQYIGEIESAVSSSNADKLKSIVDKIDSDKSLGINVQTLDSTKADIKYTGTKATAAVSAIVGVVTVMALTETNDENGAIDKLHGAFNYFTQKAEADGNTELAALLKHSLSVTFSKLIAIHSRCIAHLTGLGNFIGELSSACDISKANELIDTIANKVSQKGEGVKAAVHAAILVELAKEN